MKIKNLGAWSIFFAFASLAGAKPAAAVSAYSTIGSQNYAAQSGTCLSNGDLSCASGGDWARYDNVDFGTTGGPAYIRIALAVAPANAHQPVEIRVGSVTGQLIGTFTTASTGGANTYQIQTTTIAPITGVHSLFLVFPGSQATGPIDYFTFVAAPYAAACSLTNSGPITVTQNGQVIENLVINTNGQPAITIDGYSDVVIRNVSITHSGSTGISFDNAARLRIENVSIKNVGAPASGPLSNADWVNVDGDGSPDLLMKNVRVEKGSSGIRLLNSPRANLSFIEGHDFRGPFPRGQFVQFDNSPNSILEDFSSENGSTSWVEDNVSVFNSSSVIVRRGLVDGNNAPSGIGVMFEQVNSAVSGGLAEEVDAVRQGNGCFSGYPARNVNFTRTRCSDTICSGQDGRDPPLSNSLAWAGEPSASSNLKIIASARKNLCNASNVVWHQSVFTTIDHALASYVTRAPQRLKFCWVP